VFARPGHREIMLDPTIGLVTVASFDEVMTGTPLKASRIYVFRQHDDLSVDVFAEKITNALREGTYRPSQLLYAFHDVSAYISFNLRAAPAWQQRDIPRILEFYPTPAAPALRNNLEQSFREDH
jgi:hypothetical protein